MSNVTWVPETRLQASVTPPERHIENNQRVSGGPHKWVTLEPSGSPQCVSQGELLKLEFGFPELKLQCL
jgi:hypothetical protein